MRILKIFIKFRESILTNNYTPIIMKQFARIIQEGSQWLLWHGIKKYVIEGDLTGLTHGEIVTFYEKNLINPMPTHHLHTYITPSREFLIPKKGWIPKDLFQNRLSYLRSPEGKLLIEAKSKILQSIRKQFLGRNFIEVTTPTLVSAISEGKVSRFKVYFEGHDIFLTMTFLPYLNLLCYADNDKVFQVGNVFQSGQSNTPCQTNEYLVIDWAHRVLDKDIQAEIKFINIILFNAVKLFNKTPSLPTEAHIVEKSFLEAPLIPYQSVLSEAKKKNQSIGGQKHLSPRILESVRLKHNDLFWIYDFPRDFKPFYCNTKIVNKQEVVISAELWWKGYKIATTSLTQDSIERQKERIRYLGLNINDYGFYLDTMSDGVTPTFVSTINFERLIAKILNLKTTKEAILFPRATRHATIIP